MSVMREWILWGTRFFTGACIFHFLKRIICCLSVGGGMVRDTKYCPACCKILSEKWNSYTNSPFQRRKCSHGGSKIVKQYFFWESLGGIAFVYCGAFFNCGEVTFLSLKGGIAFAYISILTIVAGIDWNTRVIYDRFHIGILFLGMLSMSLYVERGISERFLGMVIVAFPMLILSLLVKGAFGGGDIKLMASSGFLLGWRGILVATVLGLMIGGIYCTWMLFRGKAGRKDHFALGPFLSIGLVVAYFYGDVLVKWYLLF